MKILKYYLNDKNQVDSVVCEENYEVAPTDFVEWIDDNWEFVSGQPIGDSIIFNSLFHGHLRRKS